MSDFCRGRTVHIHCTPVAHNKKADRILVLNKGEIAEEGNHDELMLNEGAYMKLWSLQMDNES